MRSIETIIEGWNGRDGGTTLIDGTGIIVHWIPIGSNVDRCSRETGARSVA